MKLGFVSAILDSWTYEEMMDFASEHGFECVEAACWPQGKAERRYAGVCHIDAEKVLTDDAYADHITEYSKEKHVEISALAFIQTQWMEILKTYICGGTFKAGHPGKR